MKLSDFCTNRSPDPTRDNLEKDAPVAQLDRVNASEALGHKFESCRAHHIFFPKRVPPQAVGRTMHPTL
jgi:hypothetical protein